jgi:HK97 family phage prohead protease
LRRPRFRAAELSGEDAGVVKHRINAAEQAAPTLLESIIMDRILCPFEVKASGDDDGTITGYGSVFGNVDNYCDTVAPGAFRKTIADAKSGAAQWPVMLSQHDQTTPIGIWTGMDEDERGLKLKGKLAINTRRGADAYALLKMTPRPALNGLSIGYVAKDFELHKSGSGPNGARRTLKAIDLHEVSLVTFPADKFARVGGVKSWQADEPEPPAMTIKELAWMQFLELRRLSERRNVR